MRWWTVEFSNDHSQVYRDITSGTDPHAIAKECAEEFGGVVYAVDGPFACQQDATEALKQ